MLACATLVGLLFLPFIGKPVYIDDSAHYAAAKDLPNHWLRPYDMARVSGEWERFGWIQGQAPSEANPPLYHYLTALCGSAVGWKIPPLHGAFFFLAWICVLTMFFLAGRFCACPEEATLLFAVSPVFWLTGTSLVIDNCLLPCALPALFFMGCGLDKTPKKQSLWAAGLLLGLAPLAKYTGLVFWPLSAWWHARSQGLKRFLRLAPYFLPPLAIFSAWCAWSQAAYGAVHPWAVIRASHMGAFSISMAVAFMSFFSGGILVPFLVLPAAWSRGGAWRFSMLGGWAATAALFASPLGGFGLPGAALLSLFLTVSAAYFACLWSRRRHFADARGQFLLAWLLLGIIASLSRGSGGWLVGRYMLILLPAVVLVTCRLAELEETGAARTWRRRLRVQAACLLALSSLLTVADYQQARVNTRLRDALASLGASRQGRRLWLPHYVPAGAGHYLRPLGWQPLARDEKPSPGDLLLVFTKSLPAALQPLPEKAAMEKVLEFGSLIPLRTNDPASGAGFYGSLYGPLPFSFSTAPLERVLVLRVL